LATQTRLTSRTGIEPATGLTAGTAAKSAPAPAGKAATGFARQTNARLTTSTTAKSSGLATDSAAQATTGPAA